MIIETIAGVTALVSLIAGRGGKGAVVAHGVAEHQLRKRNYQNGEGPLSPKADNGRGLIIHEQSPSETGRCLAAMDLFKNTWFDMTRSEGERLDELMKPLSALRRIRIMMGEEWLRLHSRHFFAPEEEKAALAQTLADVKAEMSILDTNIQEATAPVLSFLGTIPPSRQRQLPGA